MGSLGFVSEPSSLYLQGYDVPEVILSRQGTQQGCPFGSFLYCLILHKLVKKISERCPALKLHTWFMDDGSIIGKTSDVERAWKIIVEEGPADGLFANTTKSELVWPMRLPESHPFPPNMKAYPTPNCDILGAPIGTADHCDEWSRARPFEKPRNSWHTWTNWTLLITRLCFCDIVSHSRAWFFSFVQFQLIAYLALATSSTKLCFKGCNQSLITNSTITP